MVLIGNQYTPGELSGLVKFDQLRLPPPVHARQGFGITFGTEAIDPNLAFRCQQIQGASYVYAGFVKDSGLDDDGRLQPELDRTRGSNVDYLLAREKMPGDLANEATLRIVNIPHNQGLEVLPSYRYAKSALNDKALHMLHSYYNEYGPAGVRELCALATTNPRDPRGSFELIRAVFQESVLRKREELWLLTLVPAARQAFFANYGQAVMLAGDEIAVDVGDPRTSDELRLTPVIIQPQESLRQILTSIQQSHSTAETRRLTRSLYFLSDGLPDASMPAEVRTFMTQQEAYGKTLEVEV